MLKNEISYICDRCGEEAHLVQALPPGWGTFYLQPPGWHAQGVSLMGDMKHACSTCWPIVSASLDGSLPDAKMVLDEIWRWCNAERERNEAYLPADGHSIDHDAKIAIRARLETVAKVKRFVKTYRAKAARQRPGMILGDPDER